MSHQGSPNYIPVTCVDLKLLFMCQTDCDDYFGWSHGTTSKILANKQRCTKHQFERGVTLSEEDEDWRPIVGFEGLYSISNRLRIRSDKFKDRYKKITTNKQNQQVVVLLNGKGSPKMCTVPSLYRAAWCGVSYRAPKFHKPKNKGIRCVTDNKEFKSYKECAEFYGFEYNKFRKSISIDEEFAGKIFQKLS